MATEGVVYEEKDVLVDNVAGNFIFFRLTVRARMDNLSYSHSPQNESEDVRGYCRGHRFFFGGKHVQARETKTHSRLKEFFNAKLMGNTFKAAVVQAPRGLKFAADDGVSLHNMTRHWTPLPCPPPECGLSDALRPLSVVWLA